MSAMEVMTPKLRAERQKIIEKAQFFSPLLNCAHLSEDEIDAAIEELRPLRMHVHAIDYGDAPGYRDFSK